jgi:two-component system, NarL family, response regulator DesR
VEYTSTPEPTIRVLTIDLPQISLPGCFYNIHMDYLTLVREICDDLSLMDHIIDLAPHVILMHLTLKDSFSQLRLIRQIYNDFPPARVIVVTDDPRLTMSGLRAGAAGFIKNATNPAALQEMIHIIIRRRGMITTKIAKAILQEKHLHLTTWENTVLSSCADGISIQQIARQLKISPCIVQRHMGNILTKLSQLHALSQKRHQQIKRQPLDVISLYAHIHAQDNTVPIPRAISRRT